MPTMVHSREYMPTMVHSRKYMPTVVHIREDTTTVHIRGYHNGAHTGIPPRVREVYLPRGERGVPTQG